MRSLTRRSITFNFRRVFTSTCLAVCLVGLLICPAVTMTKNVNQVSPQQQSAKMQQDKATKQFESKRKAFASGRKLLLDAKVPFEPDRLLAPGWRKNLASTFAQMPEMQTVRQGTKTLKGVQLAHTLYLPEKITLTEDTVILANYLIFEGKNVEIKGAHDIHIYPIDATGLLGTTLQAAANGGRPGFSKVSFRKTALPRGMFFSPLFVQDGNITINVSGRGRTEWLQEQKEKNNRLNAGVRAHHARSSLLLETINRNGTNGSDGTDGNAGNTGLNGNHGGNGSNGVCGGNIHGLAGVGGSVGGDGADGADGTPGGNGGNGQNITGSASLGVSYTLLSNGGNGGQGGDGGDGGTGGLGGNGGRGGNGADCSCAQGGSGSGGTGGAAGTGGFGGDGGDGKNGGSAGSGGSIQFTYPSGYTGTISSSANPGTPGGGGAAGDAGFGSSAGTPGQGGTGVTGGVCSSTAGQNGNPGNTANPGEHGEPGSSGNSGSEGSQGDIDVSEEGGGGGSCPGECNEGGQGFPVDYCMYPSSGCPSGSYIPVGGCCQPYNPSPILIDVDGSGFNMCSANDGVWFDFYNAGVPLKMSWTASGSTNAWLVMDRNSNGTIDSGRELFGDFTQQPPAENRNGFLALAEYDKTQNGGNGDGVIDSRDTVFSSLRLWQDANHNGSSEAQELFVLPALGVEGIELDHKEAKKTDGYGNQFRYRAKVKDTRDTRVARWAWDVFLTTVR